MDSVLTEFISKTSAEPALARDILETNKWKLNDALENYMKDAVLKSKLIETNLDDVTEKKTNLVKSYSQPSLNGNSSIDKETVINNEPNISIKLNNKSINKSLNKLSDDDKLSSDNKLSNDKLSLSDKTVDKIATNPNQATIQKKLFRGISRATDNINLVSKVRGAIAQDFQTIKDNDLFNENLNLDLPDHTFTLPDISIHPDDFRQFLEKDLIEKSTLISLKSTKRLNWWANELNVAQELWPLSTTGDGNCLLHAASLGTWGFHDRLLTLRKALHYYLINSTSNVNSFYKRWRFQCTLENKKLGLILDESEFQSDWQNLLKMASTEPRVIGNNNYAKTTKTTIELNGGKKDICEEEFANHVYESLEEIHILALSHVLKRPIIVIADTVLKDISGQPFAPIPFGGIYLPLLNNPKECTRSPLCLTYDAAHFSSLVAMDHESYADQTPLPPAVIPLVDFENKLLPVQFIVEPPNDLKYEHDDTIIDQLSISEHGKIDLLDKYLDLVYINKNTKEVLSSNEFKKKQNQDEERKKNELNNLLKESSLASPNLNKLTVPTKLSKNLSSSTNSTANISTNISRNSRKKSFNFGSLNNLTLKFNRLKRSLSKRFKRNLNTVSANVNNLARRSSFRLSRRASKLNKSESQTKSTNNLDVKTVSTNSLNSSTNKSSSEKEKSSTKSPSKLSNKSPTKSPIKSTNSSLPNVDQQKTEESIIPNEFILAAEMHCHNLPSYRDEFIKNYLTTARLRFLNECESRSTTEKNIQKTNSSEYSSPKGSTVSCSSLNSSSSHKEDDYTTQCVNNNCVNFGKSSTNYLCEDCFISQKKELIEIRANIGSTLKTAENCV